MDRLHDAVRVGAGKARPEAGPRQRGHDRGAYIAGGLIPLAPYFIFAAAARALAVSVAFTLLALFVFGYVKGHFTGARPMRSALQTVLVGGLAAAAAFGIARAIA